MRLTPDASGVFPIAPTPFNPDGSIDWASADRLFQFYHDIGSDGVTVLGIMGEAPKLEPEESVELVNRCVARMGAKPIIVGVSVRLLSRLWWRQTPTGRSPERTTRQA